MASISHITSAGAVPTSTDTAARIPQKTLGQSDFLKLLATQFTVQDPMKPMEDTAFIAQMAQFSSLEQSKTMVQDMALLRADQQRTAANSYLGHQVTVDAGKGTTVTGDVSAIDFSGAEPKLVVGDKSFSLSAVLRIEPHAVTAPSVTPNPSIPAPTLAPAIGA